MRITEYGSTLCSTARPLNGAALARGAAWVRHLEEWFELPEDAAEEAARLKEVRKAMGMAVVPKLP